MTKQASSIAHIPARRKIALVTGASSGIGHATALRLAQEGFEVIAAARRVDRCRDLAAHVDGRAAHLDVTAPSSVEALADSIPQLDLLVNVAGGAVGTESVADARDEDWEAMFATNVMGTLRVTRAMMPKLRRSPDATIVTVTSTAGIVNYEGGGGYCAAKHAESSMVGTLRLELCGEPIRVVEIVPGMVKTEEFALTRMRGNEEAANAVYQDVDRPMVAEDVAECIAFAARLPQHVNIDRLVVRPVAQSAQHKVHRGPLFASTT